MLNSKLPSCFWPPLLMCGKQPQIVLPFKSTLLFTLHWPSKMQQPWKVTSSEFLIFNQTSLSHLCFNHFPSHFRFQLIFTPSPSFLLQFSFLLLAYVIKSLPAHTHFLLLLISVAMLFRPAQGFQSINTRTIKTQPNKSNILYNLLNYIIEDKGRKLKLISKSHFQGNEQKRSRRWQDSGQESLIGWCIIKIRFRCLLELDEPSCTTLLNFSLLDIERTALLSQTKGSFSSGSSAKGQSDQTDTS